MNAQNVFRFSLRDISEITGLSINVVRDHKNVKFNPDKLESVAWYIVRKKLERMIDEVQEGLARHRPE